MDDVGLRSCLDWRDSVWRVKRIVCMDVVVMENGDVSVVAERHANGFKFELFRVRHAEICHCHQKCIIFD